MRVAIITESFPPDLNGVAHSVLRVAELLARYGHHPLVIAPQPSRRTPAPALFDFPVVRVPAVPLPGYPGFRLGLPGGRVRAALTEHRAEVVHLASPAVLGAHGAAVVRRLRPARGRGLPDRPARLRPCLPPHRGGRGVRLALAARHPQQRRAYAGALHRHRDRPARPGHRQRLAMGPGGGHRAVRPGPPEPRAAGRAGARRRGAGRRTSAAWPPRSGSTCWPVSPGCPGSGWSSWVAARPRQRCASRCRRPCS